MSRLSIHFTTTLMNMEPEEFVSDILINKLKAKVIVVGTDYLL